ncbi:NAD(P)/FAD-dependent oxidoreductase [Neorhodopirellula pilleata]|uniref:FAD-binding domain-containing protein n=1 Tax=Neorhodopirellula pilleata TaxID=2714738 RepID=A0A5C6A0U4_9BACT|nr:FAD-dependent oxidoreductase [Neorhodopirellula pilleata]TWT93015.1 hypothetical protein Pla100_43310 [Neorhodopirellula pilleata]
MNETAVRSARDARVLVIGGGVAGITSAIRLRHRGFAVTLVERSEFPREKICGCCLGAAGLKALDSIGLGDGVRARGVGTKSFVGYLQTQRGNHRCGAPIRLPIQPGVAISRSVLDTYLMEAAIEAGVEVWQPHQAQIVDSDERSVTVRHRRSGEPWKTTDEFAAAIIATGLTGVFQGKAIDVSELASQSRWELSWVEPPHGPLGVATHVPGDHPLAISWPLVDGEIQMVCGDDGYVGLVRLPGGAIDIAAALPSRDKHKSTTDKHKSMTQAVTATPAARIVELLRSHPDISAEFVSDLSVWLQKDAHWMTAPPLRRTRKVGRGRAVAIGDCARYVEPLTGEGMTWGIESGIAVADLCDEIVQWDGEIDLSTRWAPRLDTLQPKRRVVCSSVTGALRSRVVRQLTRISLRHFRWLASPLTHGLASGAKFQTTEICSGR